MIIVAERELIHLQLIAEVYLRAFLAFVKRPIFWSIYRR